MGSYILITFFFTLLGTAYVKGYDIVKSKSPEHLPQFYLIMATIRMLLVLTVVGICILLTENRENATHIAVVSIGIYVAMMVITLSLRH